MTASTHLAGHWAAAHRTALIVLLVAAALVTAVTLVTVRMVGSAVPASGGGSTSQIQQLTPTDDTCSLVRPGQPC